jgi:hypothetical protein
MNKERQKVAMVKMWQNQRAFFKHDRFRNLKADDDEESIGKSQILGDLKAELEA